ncbi:MAG TPA: asparagine synthase (glutamine-hydrolyzing) [Phototrophicaceae bacterium]|nr:asparagine synthase (glutamine-hydrolyzing) [Phototrophicaceae bacterium]
MCGIFGILCFNPNQRVNEATLRAMSNQLIHRGPDEAGLYLSADQSFGLGVRRLSIVDVPGSHQPISNEDGRVWIGCNGEIYNFRALRAQLALRHSFSTNGDVETIVHLYENYGRRCVDPLRGMFAFALWDNAAQCLLLAIDRFGKKPLYYSLDTQRLIFASELKALLQVPDVARDLDEEALDEYFSCGYITAPRSIYRGILKLPPGHVMSIDRSGTARIECYWQPQFALPDQQDRRAPAELADELYELLLDAVRLRMTDHVGAFLSGGVDSSAVVALMRAVSGASIRTFSIGFEAPNYDESLFARQVAEHFHAEHAVEVLHPGSLTLLPELVRHFDEPFADSSMLPTYIVSQIARQHVKVVLSGDGGDEVFGGYHQHLYGYRQQVLETLIPPSLHPTTRRIAEFVPGAVKVKPYLAALDQPALHWLTNGFFSPIQRANLYSGDLRQSIREHSDNVQADDQDRLAQLQQHDLTVYLPGDILTKVDRASMRASLEVRSPLLDHTIFEFMARVPSRHRVSLTSGKSLLKRALGDTLPAFVHQRRKQGFSIPQSEWLRTILEPMLYDLLLNPCLPGLFNRAYIEQLLREHRASQVDHKDRLWALLCFELWSRQQQ